MKHSFLFFILAVVVLSSCASYSSIKSVAFPDKDNLRIVTKDNQTYVGTAPLPKITTKKIKMKTEDGQEVEINSADIAYMSAWHDKQSLENSWRLIYTPSKEYKSVKGEDGKMEMKTVDKPRWIVRVINKDNISLYFEHQQYDLDKQGNITGKSSGNGHHRHGITSCVTVRICLQK